MRHLGGWTGQIHISPTASADNIDLADDLKRILNTMYTVGSPITVDTNTTAAVTGIQLGTFSEWSGSNYGFSGTVPGYITTDDDYLIVSDGVRIRILAQDDTALSKAVFRFLDLLGYRQLLPTPEWEIIPEKALLTVAVAISETPVIKFLNGMANSGGVMSDATERLESWQKRNRIPRGGYVFNHTYGQIVNANSAEFLAHPEYRGGNGTGNKFCVLESAVQTLTLEYVQDNILTRGDLVSSVASADALTGWDFVCSGTNEQATYSPSDRQLILANYVQEQLDLEPETYNNARVSILAYGATSPTPTIDINPKIVIGVTEGYFQEGLTWQDVADNYVSKGAVDIIPYSYGSIWQFNPGLPGKSRLSDLSLVEIDIERAFYSNGTIKGLILEAPQSWGALGIPMWIIGRMLTNPDEATAQELKTEFLTLAFGSLADTMEEFYQKILGENPVTEDLIHRLYQFLKDCFDTNPSAAIKARLYDLVRYVRYLELYLIWQTTDEVEDFDELFRHMYRIRGRDLVAYRFAYSMAALDPWFEELELLYPGYTFTAFSAKPWADEDLDETELDNAIDSGLTNNELLPFDIVGYSEDLVYRDWPTDSRPRGTYLYSNRNHSWNLFIRDDQSTFAVTTRGGRQNSIEGSGYLRIYEPASSAESEDVLVGEIECKIGITEFNSIPIDPGMYRVDVIANGGVSFTWTDQVMSKITNFEPSMFQGDFSGYFMVPAGTTIIGGYSAGNAVAFRNPANSLIHTTTSGNDYFSFEISPPATDEVWKFSNGNGALTFLTVPPIIALDPEELLIPVELAA